jgi:hypothetical protein
MVPLVGRVVSRRRGSDAVLTGEAKTIAEVVNINDVLNGHVVLDLECVDRIYVNAYVPNLQVGGQVVSYLTAHLGNEIPSPAIFKRMGDRFR